MRNFYLKKSGVRAAAAAMLMVLASNAASAQDYTENNINYYIDGDEAYVGESHNATGDITILDKITVNDVDYPVTRIEGSSFYGENSENITSVHIGSAMKNIDAEAFYNCGNVTDVYISADPEQLTWYDGGHDDFKRDGTTICHVSDAAAWAKFLGEVNLTFRDATSTPFSYSYDEATHTLTISGTEAMPNYTNTTRPWSDYCSEITSLVISDGVPCINMDAFKYCTGLESVTMPASVKAICQYAFDGCTKLTTVTLGSGVSYVSNDAFSDCTALSAIKVDEANPYFMSLDGNVLTKDGSKFVLIPMSVTTLNLPATLSSFDCSLLSSLTSLTNITVDESNPNYKSAGNMLLSKDGTQLYYYYGNDATLNIPEGVTLIEVEAFYNFNGMTTINLPKSMEMIEGGYIFRSCSNLETITIPEDNEYMKTVDGILYSKDGTQLIRCPGKKDNMTMLSTVKKICSYAFAHCGLTEINIPDGVTVIEANAFYDCDKAKKVTIPQSVTTIESDAFYYCTEVTDVYCYADPEQLDWTDSGYDEFGHDDENNPTTQCHVNAADLNTYLAKWSTGDTSTDVRVIFVDDLETATSVSTVRQTAEKADGLYYNLSGQRTGKPARGLYIRNGKKVVIK